MLFYRVTLLFVQYLVPVVIITVVYMRMALRLWGSHAPGNAQDSRDANLMRNKKKVSVRDAESVDSEKNKTKRIKCTVRQNGTTRKTYYNPLLWSGRVCDHLAITLPVLGHVRNPQLTNRFSKKVTLHSQNFRTTENRLRDGGTKFKVIRKLLNSRFLKYITNTTFFRKEIMVHSDFSCVYHRYSSNKKKKKYIYFYSLV
jgi:hypothetical protein